MNTETDLQYWHKEAERRLDENNELRLELEDVQSLAIKQGEWLQSIVNITKGEPGELAQHSTHDVVESVEALRVERDDLKKQLHSNDRLTEKSREQFVAQIKAQGAREALQRATVKPGFSKALVRIDTMLEVIEKMEKQV